MKANLNQFYHLDLFISEMQVYSD